jgi:hypothetical protein
MLMGMGAILKSAEMGARPLWSNGRAGFASPFYQDGILHLAGLFMTLERGIMTQTGVVVNGVVQVRPLV